MSKHNVYRHLSTIQSSAQLVNAVSTDQMVQTLALAIVALATQLDWLARQTLARPVVHIKGVPDAFIDWGQE